MQIFKLNIYKRRQVEKTLECKDYDIMYGTLEDILEVAQLGKDISSLRKLMDFINPLLLELFVDATMEDLKRAKLRDVFQLIQEVIGYALNEMDGRDAEDGEKNA